MKSTNVGPFRVSPHKRDGEYTGGWLVNIPATQTGPRCRKFFDKREDALTYAKGLDRLYRQGEFTSPRKADTTPSITFRDAVSRWLKIQQLRVRTSAKRPVSLATDYHRLKAALAFFGDMKLPDITEEKLMAFQAERKEANRKPSTINSDVVAIGKVLRWAYKADLLKKLPTVERLPKKARKEAPPTREEIGRIIHALPERLRLLVRLMAESGCRRGEAFNLTWDCLDEAGGFVNFSEKDDWAPKTEESDRKVPIRPELMAELLALPQAGKYVFPGRTPNQPLKSIRKAFASALKVAGISRHLTPHSLRRAFATWAAVECKMPQPVLQSILGHAPGSTVTNEHYVKVSDEAKRAAISGLPL